MKRLVAIVALSTFALTAGCGGGAKATHTSTNGPIVFVRFASERDGIFRVDPDGSHEQQLTNLTGGFDDLTPAWSTDGGSIAFIRRSSPGNVFRLYVMNATGGDLHLVSGLPKSTQPGLGWSPDNKQILFAARGGVYTVSAAGGTARLLVKARLPDYASWSSDGKTIVFDQNGHVYLAGANGKNIRRLTRAPKLLFEEQPSLSPDGQSIAYVQYKLLKLNAAPAIKVTRIDGSGTRTVVKLGLAERQTAATWAPDGSSIAYGSTAPLGLVSVPVGGGKPRLLIKGPLDNPNWGPAR